MNKGYAGLFLRLGLAFIFLYFGTDKFFNQGINEATFRGLWMSQAVPLGVPTQVIVAGVLEAAMGIFLLSGAFNPYISIAAAAWTFIIFINLGFSAGVYDLALTSAGIALRFTGPGKYSLNLKYINTG